MVEEGGADLLVEEGGNDCWYREEGYRCVDFNHIKHYLQCFLDRMTFWLLHIQKKIDL